MRRKRYAAGASGESLGDGRSTREARDVRHTRADHAQGGRTAHPGAADPLRDRLPGPGQRHVRPGQARERPRLLRRRLRLRRGRVLHRLLLLRGPEQPGAAQVRRAQVDGAHHGHLGPDLGVHGARAGAGELLRRALPARHRRGRLLPRDDPLSLVLVPEPRAGEGGRVLHVGDRDLLRDRRADLRRHHVGLRRRRRPPGLAVAVHHRGDPGADRGGLRPLLPRRRARGRDLAGAGREALAGGSPARRGEGAPGARAPHGRGVPQGPPRAGVRAPLLHDGRQRLRPVVLGRRDRRQGRRPERRRQGVRDRDPVRRRDRRAGRDLALLGSHRRPQAGRRRLDAGRRRRVRAQHRRLAGGGDRVPGRRAVLPARRAPGVLGDAGRVPQRGRGGCGHRADQLDRQPRRLRRPLPGRPDEGRDRLDGRRPDRAVLHPRGRLVPGHARRARPRDRDRAERAHRPLQRAPAPVEEAEPVR